MVPSTATNMEELTELIIHWDSGEFMYDKNDPVVKCFEESSGCFELLKEFRKNGPTNYDHPSLRKLIYYKEYNRAAPTEYEIEKILNYRKIPRKQSEFLVRFKGFRMEVWLQESACQDCKELTKEFMKKRRSL